MQCHTLLGPIAQLVSPDSYRGTHNQVVPGSPRKLSGGGAHNHSSSVYIMSRYYCYILYSSELDRFYTGATILDPEQRLENHLIEYYGKKKFTVKVKDWQLFLAIECVTIEQARQIERHIKRMKSSTYIRNLIAYPAIVEKLKAQYL